MASTPVKNEPQGNTLGVDLSHGVDNAQLPANQLASQLGGSGKHNINWLYGSYAGADIKVIAHLYTPTTNSEIEELDKAIAASQDINKGAQTYLNSNLDPSTLQAGLQSSSRGPGPSYQERQFELAIGASTISQDAVDYLYDELWPAYLQLYRKPPDTAGLIVAEFIINEQSAVEQSLLDKQKVLKDINDASSHTVVLENLQTISVQSTREKTAVRSLGKSYVSGYVRGPRSIGGSMIFTMIREHPLTRLIKAIGNAKLYGETPYDLWTSTLIPDQLPPIDLTLVFANEYGSISKMGIYGVEFLNDGLTLSSEDILTEVVCQFTARDIDIPSDVGIVKLSQKEKGIYDTQGKPVSASELYINSQSTYNDFLWKVGLRHSFKGR